MSKYPVLLLLLLFCFVMIRPGVTDEHLEIIINPEVGLQYEQVQKLYTKDNLLGHIEHYLSDRIPNANGGYSNIRWTHPRRNHDGMFIRTKNNSNYFYLNFGGRFAPNVEVYDMLDHKSKMYLVDHPLLNINHFNLIPMKNFSRPNGIDFYMLCGFTGDEVNLESEIENMRVLSWDPDNGDTEFSLYLGPRLFPRGVGGCASLSFPQISGTFPDTACMFGGSSGSHDNGIFWNSSWCYRSDTSNWFRLPDTPMVHDHGNVGIIDSRACKDSDPEKIVIMGFRSSSYGENSDKIYALDIYRDSMGKIISYGETWHLLNSETKLFKYSLFIKRSAGGVLFVDKGRYILQFGGVTYDKNYSKIMRAESSEYIYAFDSCAGTWISKPVARFRTGRFAVMTHSTYGISLNTSHLSSDPNEHYAVTCGGRSGFFQLSDPNLVDLKSKNLQDCEIFKISTIIKAIKNTN